jgi:hypothetical protein
VDQQGIKAAVVVTMAVAIVAARAMRSSRSRRRESQLAAIAAALGLRFSSSDSARCDRIPFSFFDGLREPRAENVMTGAAHGCDLRIFDF